ncbi:GNAT family N-acetyltransferase [Paenibacillus sp. RC67]|uniref:GNAT family N-acetyltransferase n=1 Tax=Paenibacillus sp. RC67 TaxID=3039392 RepID=UPI0024ADE278|nr:GNAT family N-acetyltransferase [Paenibacillus sp. RC67]
MELIFRLHRRSDTDVIVSMINREPLHLMNGIVAEEFEQGLDEPGERIRDNTFVVETEQTIVACFSLCFVKRDSHIAVYCYGTVDTDWRRRGIGTAMFHFIFSRLEKQAKQECIPIHFIHRAITLIPGETTLGIQLGMQEQNSLEILRLNPLLELKDFSQASGLLFRTPTVTDAQSWAEIYNDAFGGNRSVESVVHEFQGTGFSPNLYIMCTDTAGEPMGIVLSILRGTQARIPTVAVRREYQKRGVGKALLSLILQRLKALGAEDVRLSVESKNIAAKSLYHQYGFQQDYMRINYAAKFLP